MSDVQLKLGQALLDGISELRRQKEEMSLEDVGGIFMQVAASINPSGSVMDKLMHQEIARLASYITDAKKEIFAISSSEKSRQTILDASQHLDEVIKATEEASNAIMDAADAIQNAASGVGGDKEAQIQEATGRIYEACNFQDITGQRITKVIKLLENIEERVSRLNSLFGASEGNGSSAAANTDLNSVTLPKDDKELMNGPQLSGQGVSQDDIDALFSNVAGKK